MYKEIKGIYHIEKKVYEFFIYAETNTANIMYEALLKMLSEKKGILEIAQHRTEEEI
jgi:hypothetical protein